MLWSYVQLDDGTQLAYSEIREDGAVRVAVERPVDFGFDHAECFLPAVKCFTVERQLSMFSLTDISTAVSRVLARYDVREAYLFGSFARGEQTPDSDIDLRLVCGKTMTFGTLYELSHELEKELGRKVDIVTNPPDHMRPAFRKNLEQDEVRLYEAK